MKSHTILFPSLLVIAFLLVEVIPVSAQENSVSQVGTSPRMMELRKDQATTSNVVGKETRGNSGGVVTFEDNPERMQIEPDRMMIAPVGDDGERRGPAQPSEIQPLRPVQLEEQRQERSIERQQREEQLRSMNRSDRAKERMSDVAKRVEVLLANPDRNGGIGSEVQEIARAHRDAQPQLEENLEAVDSRNRFATFLVGPDRSALQDIKQEANQIDGRIAQLNASLETITDEATRSEVSLLIEDLEGQRNDLLETVEVKSDSFSVVGWMRRLFGQTN